MKKHKPGISDLVDYILETECEDYFENDQPEGHVYQIARDNGLVMAAAPDMLAALRKIITENPRDQGFPGFTEALAAIAKAEGRTK